MLIKIWSVKVKLVWNMWYLKHKNKKLLNTFTCGIKVNILRIAKIFSYQYANIIMCYKLVTWKLFLSSRTNNNQVNFIQRYTDCGIFLSKRYYQIVRSTCNLWGFVFVTTNVSTLNQTTSIEWITFIWCRLWYLFQV